MNLFLTFGKERQHKAHIARLHLPQDKMKERCCQVPIPSPPPQSVVEQIKVKSSHLDVMSAQVSPLSECREAHALQQTWPLRSDIASRAPRTGTRTGTGWQDASLTTPQVCAERSSQDSLPSPPSEEALTPAITPFAPKSLQWCSVALLFHTQPAGMGMPVTFLLPDRGITNLRRIRHISVNKIQEESELQWTIYWKRKKILFAMCSDKALDRGSSWAADFLFVALQQQFSSAPLHLPTGSCCKIWLLHREERGRQETTTEFPTDPRRFIIACW